MLIPDQLRKCVAFAYFKRAMSDPPKTVGTVFFVGWPEDDCNFAYAVTAKHVVEAVKRDSPDDKVLLRLNTRQGDTELLSTSVSDWLFHPTEENVDVAVLPVTWSLEAFDQMIYLLKDEMILTPKWIEDEDIGAGEDVFIIGLFRNQPGASRNIPVVRVGNIAAMNEEPVKTEWHEKPLDAYIIEARSIGGLSGSPVFLSLGMMRHGKASGNLRFTAGTPRCLLLGLVHGHWSHRVPDVDASDEDAAALSKLHAGMSIVTPVQKLVETLNHPILVDQRTTVKMIRTMRATETLGWMSQGGFSPSTLDVGIVQQPDNVSSEPPSPEPDTMEPRTPHSP